LISDARVAAHRAVRRVLHARNFKTRRALTRRTRNWESVMGFGRGILLWLLGVPLPIIILLALFWHN